MVRVLIWGVGEKGDIVLDTINQEDCKVVGFVDNNPEKSGKLYKGEMIYSSDEMPNDFDYLIIAVWLYKAIVYQLVQMNFPMGKVIVFYDEKYLKNREDYLFLDWKAWKIAVLEEKLKVLERVVETGFSNIGYEIIDKNRKNGYQYPIIADDEELIDKIVREGRSFIRFGDGEFEIIFRRGIERQPFQKSNIELSKRLKEILTVSDQNILIGIADNYGSLERYAKETIQGIRDYMTEDTRSFHLSVLDLNRIYYNAYVFKTYMPHKDKENTKKRVSLICRIWDNRDIVFIEGDKTRTGYGNDLFDNAKSIKRILCPTFNAYSKYDEILACGKKLNKDCLILIVLGPAGKVLAYDLIQEGYQVVDIGQVDMDYDWYLSGAGFRVPNPNKYVSQLPPTKVNEIQDDTYSDQILYKVE